MIVVLEGLQAGNRSGTGVYTEELVRRLPEATADLELAVLWPEGVATPRLAAGARVDFVPVRRSGLGALAGRQFGARREAVRRRADVVHYPATVGNVVGGKNMVVTIHDLSFLRHPEWFRSDRAMYYRWTVRRSARRAARLIADSRATAEDLRALLGIPEDRIDVVPLGVDERFRPASREEQAAVRQRYGLPERFFLFMGTLEPRKNLVRIVEAWTRVAADLPLDLVLAGRRGWKTEALHRAVLSNPHTARIHLPDYIAPEDQAAVLSAAEAFVWPSLYEGFGLPPLEAMACGTPVLTSDGSSLREAAGDAALLVDPTDTAAIAEGMRRIVEDGDCRRRLVAWGLARAAEFSWRRTAEETVGVYRRVAG